MNDKLETVLSNTARTLMADGKGLLAMDESSPTSNKRFALYDIAQTPENRRDYRELLATTPGLGEYISGAILYEETVRQLTSKDESFIDVLDRAGIIPGIKLDTGTTDLANFPGEKITEGLDGLPARLIGFASLGLRFAKWRVVFSIGEGIPTDECIHANTQSLARYAALCQQAGLVPIVEPEVLMDGNHSLATCFEVTERVLKSLFYELYKQRVLLEGIILKPNMVLPGLACAKQNSNEEIADTTVKCLLRSVPAAVPGIAFLSGGQSSELATERLNQMNLKYGSKLPWPVTFSFSRAIQLPALECWKGQSENTVAAQKILLYKAQCNSLARKGQYVMDPKTPV
ncbi:class I fructose-bisphosphate aldolase [Dyadobacter frigoris]|uniref:Fructose-bisphosphate aldolase n=1 Tax=Dyadobacter frigoris TaxID=2576211 RepID=A0A4U6CP73_9BACT|nr:class I fructose-bisphosphate aldolase [Dyadobacter frigoris]TKT86229.1 fructose-bisphosphate aldolase class I [Dyadobacter frigoris]GLU56932.1 putative fructose-bisphosphate aldolase class 1 [Dyadobacter frigoris]